MRLLLIVLAVLVLAVQWPLWFGKGGWFRVWELQRTLAVQAQANEAMRLRNQQLATELASLQEAREAIEERARFELNMVRNDEIFFQVPVAR
jgi:cell division protein FtsB